eukprot:TRINITY_DN8327_c1_g1_i3.p1 TRINITY_DN8327_c1_g1~~TRINITY_DN8327_c1_g1_i3.p1  ORF type:complete len:399 (+),score=39.60 TRINITY_DN8327_c1_g1_i3:136-1197(+)
MTINNRNIRTTDTNKSKKPTKETVGGAGVLVCNLPPSLQHEDLRSLFREFGVVVSCCLEWTADQCVAIVELKRQSDANKAVVVLNGTTIDNQVLTAALYPIVCGRQAPDLVFIQFLPALYTFSDVQTLLQLHGGVVKNYWWVSSDYVSNVQNALVRMENAEQAQAVVSALDCVFFIGCSRNLQVKLINRFVREDYEFESSDVQSEKVPVKKSSKRFELGWRINFEQSTEVMLRLKAGKSEKQKLGNESNNYNDNNNITATTTNKTFGICVKNIPGDSARHQYAFLVAHFIKYGSIAKIKVLRYPNGRSFGYGFVDFYEAQAASTALNKLNGVAFGKKTLKVSLSDKTVQQTIS